MWIEDEAMEWTDEYMEGRIAWLGKVLRMLDEHERTEPMWLYEGGATYRFRKAVCRELRILVARLGWDPLPNTGTWDDVDDDIPGRVIAPNVGAN